MEDLRVFLLAHAQGDLIPWSAQVAAADRFHRTIGSVEEAALELGWMPARYQRNRRTVSIAEQLTLFRSRVVIVGAGGLGGYVIEELARLGVGTLVVADYDTFEEHNLNRQLLATLANLGAPKVEAAVERVGAINPAVVASLQVAEVCKILLGQGRVLDRRMLFLDLLEMEFEEVPIASDAAPGDPSTR